MRDRESLRLAISRFVRSGLGDFDELACQIHALQLENNPVLARMFPGPPPATAADIPAVPVSLFKSLDLGPQPALPSDRSFRTSGTTGQTRGTVRCRDTFLYDLASPKHFAHRVEAVPKRVVSLCPADEDSSLGHMVTLFSGGDATRLFAEGGVRTDAWDHLSKPCFLAATAFALDALFAIPGRANLARDSLVMVTGGFKGRRVRLDDAALYGEFPARLGDPRVVGEYGMTELSAQLWTDPVRAGERPGAFVAPPWMKVFAVDPVSGSPISGEGVLRFVDLCNLDSPVAIETEDLGRVESRADGDRVTLVGRLAGAEARGCSLRAEDFARRSGA